MSFNDAYFAADGYTWSKGVKLLPRNLARAIWEGLNFTQRSDAVNIFFRASVRLQRLS
jgi:hypothetical protein